MRNQDRYKEVLVSCQKNGGNETVDGILFLVSMLLCWSADNRLDWLDLCAQPGRGILTFPICLYTIADHSSLYSTLSSYHHASGLSRALMRIGNR